MLTRLIPLAVVGFVTLSGVFGTTKMISSMSGMRQQSSVPTGNNQKLASLNEEAILFKDDGYDKDASSRPILKEELISQLADPQPDIVIKLNSPCPGDTWGLLELMEMVGINVQDIGQHNERFPQIIDTLKLAGQLMEDHISMADLEQPNPFLYQGDALEFYNAFWMDRSDYYDGIGFLRSLDYIIFTKNYIEGDACSSYIQSSKLG